MAPVATGLVSNGVVGVSLSLHVLAAQSFEHQFGSFTRQDEALGYRGTAVQRARKRVVGPSSREMDKAMTVVVTIHDTRYGAKRQVWSIQWMGNKQRVLGRRFDGPEVVEFHRQSIIVGERRAGDLLTQVK